MTTQPPSVPAAMNRAPYHPMGNVLRAMPRWGIAGPTTGHPSFHELDEAEKFCANLNAAFSAGVLSKSSPASLPMGVEPLSDEEIERLSDELWNMTAHTLEPGEIVDGRTSIRGFTRLHENLQVHLQGYFAKLLAGASFQRVGVEEIMEVVQNWENDVSLGKLPMRHDAWFNDLRSRLTALLSKEGSWTGAKGEPCQHPPEHARAGHHADQPYHCGLCGEDL